MTARAAMVAGSGLATSAGRGHPVGPDHGRGPLHRHGHQQPGRQPAQGAEGPVEELAGRGVRAQEGEPELELDPHGEESAVQEQEVGGGQGCKEERGRVEDSVPTLRSTRMARVFPAVPRVRMMGDPTLNARLRASSHGEADGSGSGSCRGACRRVGCVVVVRGFGVDVGESGVLEAVLKGG